MPKICFKLAWATCRSITRRRISKNRTCLAEIFSLAVNKSEPVAAVLEEQFDYFLPQAAQIAAVHERYQARKKTANAMDFDDLLALWLKLLQEYSEAREEQQRRFQFVLVDEYQDTNKIQGALWICSRPNTATSWSWVMTRKSITRGAGAHFQNILKFPERIPKLRFIGIEMTTAARGNSPTGNAAIAANLHNFPSNCPCPSVRH